MSYDIPFEIQAEIMKRLPVRSLIQFRSVSKQWKSLIDSSHFISHYSSQQQHLLARYVKLGSLHPTYLSIVDDHTFPRHRVSLTVPMPVNMPANCDIIGTSCGLLCLYSNYQKGRNGPVSGSGMVVIWNPAIRKFVAVGVCNVMFRTYLGFGVCRETADPKIVKITCRSDREDAESVVEVFRLSSRAWRNPGTNLPRKSIKLFGSPVEDGCLYWLAMDRITTDGGFSFSNIIISFDMTSEEFREVNLPDDLSRLRGIKLSLSKVRESLVVVEDVGHGVEAIWMMDDGVSKSFTKLFTVNVNTPPAQVRRFRGFRKTGEPIIEVVQHNLHGQLVVYEPESEHVDELEIDGKKFSFSVFSYVETLLLLDQPNLIIR
ncbi:putative F-box domain-containing protein [Helianthus annuus]|nr:putative F-box domain-containing protein [Helianthus annuus]